MCGRDAFQKRYVVGMLTASIQMKNMILPVRTTVKSCLVDELFVSVISHRLVLPQPVGYWKIEFPWFSV